MEYLILSFPLLIVWLIACLAVAKIAEEKKRSVLGYFLLSLFASPLFGAILLASAGGVPLDKPSKIK